MSLPEYESKTEQQVETEINSEAELPDVPKEIDFEACPHCGQKRPIYEAVSSVSEIDPHREAGLRWVRVDWHMSGERPIEATYTRGCPKHAGVLEQFCCRHCKGVVNGMATLEMRMTLERLTSRKRMADDGRLIWWMQQLMAELARMSKWQEVLEPMFQERLSGWLEEPDVMFQEHDFGITKRHLCEYLIEAARVQNRLLEDPYSRYSDDERPEKLQHNWEAMLKLIKQAERMRVLRYPRAKDPNNPKYANGVVELLPNGKREIVVADYTNSDDPIWQWQRVHYFGLAYNCALYFPERSFWVRQMSDVEPVPFMGVHNLED